MSTTLTTFIESRMPQPGVAAWVMRSSDGSFANCCYSDALSAAQIEQTLGGLAVAAESIRPHGIDHALLCWVFALWRMHVALRPDGACLVLFVENRPANVNIGHEGMMDEFLRVAS